MRLTIFVNIILLLLIVIEFDAVNGWHPHFRHISKWKKNIFKKFHDGMDSVKTNIYDAKHNLWSKKRAWIRKLTSKLNRHSKRYNNKQRQNDIVPVQQQTYYQTPNYNTVNNVESRNSPSNGNSIIVQSTYTSYSPSQGDHSSNVNKISSSTHSSRRTSELLSKKVSNSSKKQSKHKANSKTANKHIKTPEKPFDWRPFNPSTNEISPQNVVMKNSQPTNLTVRKAKIIFEHKDINEQEESSNKVASENFPNSIQPPVQSEKVPLVNKVTKSQEIIRNVKRGIKTTSNQNIDNLQKHMVTSVMTKMGLDKFTQLIRKANVEPILLTEGGFTIFAPTNEAFDLLPGRVVLQLQLDMNFMRDFVLSHIALGRFKANQLHNEIILGTVHSGYPVRLNSRRLGSKKVLTVNGALILNKDIDFANGVLHEINRALYPTNNKTILEHFSSCSSLQGMNLAIDGTGLRSLLSGGPFTVFAPSTSTFSSLDNTTVSDFITNIVGFQDILLHHIVEGTYYSESLRDGTWLSTVNEKEIQMKVTTDGFTRRLTGVGVSRVVKSDIPASNGVIHIIEGLIRDDTLCTHF